jgi:nicotinamidase-related amidase
MGTTALIVIDMLNPYEHEDADALAANVEPVLAPLAELIAGVHESDAEVVYVNDNYGDFAATRDDLIRGALEGRRADLIEPIVPPEGVAFLQKARHSAFYSTALDHLLRGRGLETLVLTGQVTEQCILYTALDAYVRHLPVVVPRDAVAHIDAELAEAALKMMQKNMSAEIATAADCLG